MAQDVANDINYFLLLELINKEDLYRIRQLDNLKLAFDENHIWVKDFNYIQINSLEVKSIPYKTVLYSKQNKLFLIDSLLPDRNVPSLLWTSIERALPIKLPSFNHNYFGIHENFSIQLIPSNIEEETIAGITTLDILGQYIKTAPTIRLEKIRWAILNNNKVFLMGQPILPIKAETYWRKNDLIIPTGFNFDLYLLIDSLNNLLNPLHNNWVIWETDNTYFLIDKHAMQPLSLSSFRLSLAELLPL